MNEDDKAPPSVTEGGWLGPAIARAIAGEPEDERDDNVIVLADYRKQT